LIFTATAFRAAAATDPTRVRLEAELLAALDDSSVAEILITADIKVTPEAWPALGARVTRPLTIRGAGCSGRVCFLAGNNAGVLAPENNRPLFVVRMDAPYDGSGETVGMFTVEDLELKHGTQTIQSYQQLTSSAGGAVIVRVGAGTFNRVKFNGNSAFEGGAVHVDDFATASFDWCVFEANSAYEGGAVAIEGHTTFTDCDFRYNSATEGGAIRIRNELRSNDVVHYFAQATFTGNIAERNGLDLYVGESSHVIMDRPYVQRAGALRQLSFVVASGGTLAMQPIQSDIIDAHNSAIVVEQIPPPPSPPPPAPQTPSSPTTDIDFAPPPPHPPQPSEPPVEDSDEGGSGGSGEEYSPMAIGLFCFAAFSGACLCGCLYLLCVRDPYASAKVSTEYARRGVDLESAMTMRRWVSQKRAQVELNAKDLKRQLSTNLSRANSYKSNAGGSAPGTPKTPKSPFARAASFASQLASRGEELELHQTFIDVADMDIEAGDERSETSGAGEDLPRPQRSPDSVTIVVPEAERDDDIY